MDISQNVFFMYTSDIYVHGYNVYKCDGYLGDGGVLQANIMMTVAIGMDDVQLLNEFWRKNQTIEIHSRAKKFNLQENQCVY